MYWKYLSSPSASSTLPVYFSYRFVIVRSSSEYSDSSSSHPSPALSHASGLGTPSPPRSSHASGLGTPSPPRSSHASGLGTPSPPRSSHASGLGTPSAAGSDPISKSSGIGTPSMESATSAIRSLSDSATPSEPTTPAESTTPSKPNSSVVLSLISGLSAIHFLLPNI